MRLYLLAEAISPQQLEKVAERIGTSAGRLKGQLDIIDRETGCGFALPWILKQVGEHNLRFPEDIYRVVNALKPFKEVKAHLEVKDINRYPNLHALEDAIEAVRGKTSKRKGDNGVDFRKLPGVIMWSKNGDQTLVSVDNAETLALLGNGTKWCTRAEYGYAKDYIEEYGEIFILFDGLKPVIQFTPDFEQVMDRNDVECGLPEWVLMWGWKWDELGSIGRACEMAIKSKIRIPELEQIMFESDGLVTYMPDYAKACIGGRWPEAEPFIARQPHASWEYVIDVVGGRWPPGELAILKNGDYAADYAIRVLKRRWPDAELAIARDYRDAARYIEFLTQSKAPNGNYYESVDYLNNGFEKLGSPIRYEVVNLRPRLVNSN